MATRRVLISVLILALAVMVPAASSAQTIAHTIRIEAESFTDYHDIAFELIRSFPITGCSSGFVLYGLDTPNEWVEYTFTPNAMGVYSFTLHCVANAGQSYYLQIQLTGGISGEVQTIDVNFTGTGYG